MIRSLKEAFGIDVPTYLMGIAYETMGHDEEQNSMQKKRGWVVPYQECDPEEMSAYATKYQIPARYGNDSRKYWETEDPFKDGMSGDEVYHIMVVKNVDGSDINEEDFSSINDKFMEEDEGLGMKINTRPDSVYY